MFYQNWNQDYLDQTRSDYHSVKTPSWTYCFIFKVVPQWRSLRAVTKYLHFCYVIHDHSLKFAKKNPRIKNEYCRFEFIRKHVTQKQHAIWCFYNNKWECGEPHDLDFPLPFHKNKLLNFEFIENIKKRKIQWKKENIKVIYLSLRKIIRIWSAIYHSSETSNYEIFKLYWFCNGNPIFGTEKYY